MASVLRFYLAYLPAFLVGNLDGFCTNHLDGSYVLLWQIRHSVWEIFLAYVLTQFCYLILFGNVFDIRSDILSGISCGGRIIYIYIYIYTLLQPSYLRTADTLLQHAAVPSDMFKRRSLQPTMEHTGFYPKDPLKVGAGGMGRWEPKKLRLSAGSRIPLMDEYDIRYCSLPTFERLTLFYSMQPCPLTCLKGEACNQPWNTLGFTQRIL